MDNKKIKKPHLGRGLEALLGTLTIPAQEAQNSDTIMVAGEEKPSFPPDKMVRESKNELSISKIKPNPFQPRTVWNEQELNELAESIRQVGVLQPVVVRPAADGMYEIIAGERRFRASQIAGLSDVPVLIRQATDQQMLELALVENIHRADLNPIERAIAYQNYINTFNISQSDAARRLGEDRTAVVNYLRLLELPQDIKEMLIAGKLQMGHARAILALPTEQLRRTLANKALAGRLSVREVERFVNKYLDEEKKAAPVKKEKATNIIDLEKQFQQLLGTKVRIESGRRNKGRIIIEYYSLDDFDRLAETIGLKFSKDENEEREFKTVITRY